MAKEILQITIKQTRKIKTKFGRWWHRNVYWKIWVLAGGSFKAWFYQGVSNFMLSLLPKEKREEILKEYEEIEIHIVDETKSK